MKKIKSQNIRLHLKKANQIRSQPKNNTATGEGVEEGVRISKVDSVLRYSF